MENCNAVLNWKQYFEKSNPDNKKTIIDGKRYDTKTAFFIGYYSYSYKKDWRHFEETLYRKENDEFFLYVEGGPLSNYRTVYPDRTFGPGEKVVPLSEEEAREWVEQYESYSTYVKLFGEPEE